MIFISNIVAFAKSISIIYTTEFIYIFFIHRTNTMSANTRERESENNGVIFYYYLWIHLSE